MLRRGELFGIFPEGTRSRDGVLHKGRTGAARLALKVGCPIFPVGVVGTDEIQPPDAKVPKLFAARARSRSVGRSASSAIAAAATSTWCWRQITDEVMFEIRELTGQEYGNVLRRQDGRDRADGGGQGRQRHRRLRHHARRATLRRR